MAGTTRLAILSDVHYASAAEVARGDDYEITGIQNPLLRAGVKLYRRRIWLHRPLHQNHLLERFLDRVGTPDLVVANGDYTCDTACLGVSDLAALQSVRECLGKLRDRFGDKLQVTFGDHELGKVSFFGGRGGLRLASWYQAQTELGIKPLWQVNLGRYTLVGIVSSLVALPVFEADTLPAERAEWRQLREEHLEGIRKTFEELGGDQRILLFCHDPSALPFLWREPAVAARAGQIERTVIGHLHSRLILWKSRWLAGMPRITFLGHTAKRLSTALREAQHWRPFRVELCPSLAGIELLKDGGFLTVDLDPEGNEPARFQLHHLPRD